MMLQARPFDTTRESMTSTKYTANRTRYLARRTIHLDEAALVPKKTLGSAAAIAGIIAPQSLLRARKTSPYEHHGTQQQPRKVVDPLPSTVPIRA